MQWTSTRNRRGCSWHGASSPSSSASSISWLSTLVLALRPCEVVERFQCEYFRTRSFIAISKAGFKSSSFAISAENLASVARGSEDAGFGWHGKLHCKFVCSPDAGHHADFIFRAHKGLRQTILRLTQFRSFVRPQPHQEKQRKVLDVSDKIATFIARYIEGDMVDGDQRRNARKFWDRQFEPGFSM